MKNLVEYEITVRDRVTRLRMSEIRVDEWCEVETLSGMDAGELYTRFLAGGIRARKAFVYMAWRRAGHRVSWDSPDLNFTLGDFEVKDVTPTATLTTNGGEADVRDPQETVGSASPPP